MKTVKEWINFLGNNKDYIFGLQLKNGVPCPRSHYYPKAEALKIFSDYLDEVVIDAYPMNFKNGDKTAALLIY